MTWMGWLRPSAEGLHPHSPCFVASHKDEMLIILKDERNSYATKTTWKIMIANQLVLVNWSESLNPFTVHQSETSFWEDSEGTAVIHNVSFKDVLKSQVHLPKFIFQTSRDTCSLCCVGQPTKGSLMSNERCPACRVIGRKNNKKQTTCRSSNCPKLPICMPQFITIQFHAQASKDGTRWIFSLHAYKILSSSYCLWVEFQITCSGHQKNQ